MEAIGFDFGTTNSLISIIQGDKVINLYDDQGLPIPSVVCYEGTQTLVGREARERLAQAGLGVQGNVVLSPKTLLGRESVFVGGVERNPVDIVRHVVEFVRNQAMDTRTVKNLTIDKAVVTIPVNMEGYRRALLRDAFRMAGINIVQFIHEPLAALYGFLRTSNDFAATLRQYNRQLILVFDWGGGTLDLTLCRLVDDLLVQVVNDGTDEVGGDLFDETLKNEVEQRFREAKSIPENANSQPEARARLMHACERAKIDLSQRSQVNVYVPNFFRGLDDPDLDYPLPRDELESMVAKLIDKGMTRVEKLLESQDYSSASVAMCLVTGGMANMPAIKARLHELFGPQRVHIPEHTASLISEGAAWVAHDDAKLHLAKNVELVLARNSYMPLLAANLEMPQEGETRCDNFSLYCVDPTDGYGKFQLMAPRKPGPKVLPNDIRRPLANLVVQVDKKAPPFQERLSLDVTIDENLIFKATARSLNQRGYAEAEVHDLEFALALPSMKLDLLDEESFPDTAKSKSQNESGSLVMRSNIAAHEKLELVPGEVLYRFNPMYFDLRRHPPQFQVDEHLYYTPCSICGRPSNDPLCSCASLLDAKQQESVSNVGRNHLNISNAEPSP
ncbi:MAG: Hsp70 family protein [Pseudomonadota bacterium]|nr:Hsp70 family protein [Pseudomonadota bacterium]